MENILLIRMNNFIEQHMLYVRKRFLQIEEIFVKFDYYKNNHNYCELSKEYNKLIRIKTYYSYWIKIQKELQDTFILLQDIELCELAKQEIKRYYLLIKKLFDKLKLSFDDLYNKKKRNVFDILNAYVEIYAGTGGNEASLFVLDLFKMYVKYADLQKFKVDLITSNTNNYGGYKYIIMKIIGKGVYGKLKYESGGHRVQRIPVTESLGRVHTSTCKVAVIPDIPVKELPIIKNEDLRIDTFRSSGAGGQHVNTTDSAIRIKHIPTGIVVECQQERSQYKNKQKALEVLKARVYALDLEHRKKEISLTRQNLLGKGIRSDRSRTYNFIQNRVTDHRINYTSYALDSILNGKLELLINTFLKYT